MLVPSRVITSALGASTQVADVPKDPPVQLTARPPAAGSASGIDSTKSSPDDTTAGVNISTRRPAASASTSAGVGCCATSRQVR